MKGGGAVREVVYVDVLLFVNLFVNYFLLRAAALLSRERAGRWRMILGAALGSTYSLIIFLPPLHPAFLVALKAAMALSIVLASFGWKSLRRFTRVFLCFLAETFLFGGVNYAVYTFLKPGGMIYGNSAVYYDISVPLLVAVTAVCYALSVLVSKWIRRDSPENLSGEADIRVGEKHVRVPMMIDSGNGLADPFSDEPVCVLCADSAVKLLPPDDVQFFLGERELPEAEAARGVRLIPYNAVGGGGVLRAFRCDLLTLRLSGREDAIRGVWMAVVPDPFDGGRYQLLVNPRLAEREKREYPTSLRIRGVKQNNDPKYTMEAAPAVRGQKEKTRAGDFLHQRFADTAAAAGERGGDADDRAPGAGGSRRA